MKNILKMLIAMLAVSVVACETYEVEAPDVTPVAGLDGRYICWAYDLDEYQAASDKSTVEPVDYFETRISVTESYVSDKVWIYVCSFLYTYPYANVVCAKIDCDVSTLSFWADGAEKVESPRIMFNPVVGGGYYTVDYRLGFTEGKVTITDGKVVKDGYDTPTGYKADAISYAYEYEDADGNTEKYMIVGSRYTGWGEDYEEFNDFINNF